LKKQVQLIQTKGFSRGHGSNDRETSGGGAKQKPRRWYPLVTLIAVVLAVGGILISIVLALRSPKGEDSIHVGRVLPTALGEIRKNVAPFVLMALVLAGVPAFLVGYWNYDPQAGEVDVGNPGYWISGLPGILIGYLLQGAMIAHTVSSLSGRPAGIGPSLLLALRRILPILAATILSYLAIAVGFVFLLVPGLILFTIWILIVPVIVEEGAGVFGSFGRSAALTAGSRWRIFALLAIMFAIQMGVSLLADVIASFAGGGPVASALAAAFSAGFSAILLATVLASLYVEARNVKEGRGVSGLESIFQ
jgi:hypothetical protein